MNNEKTYDLSLKKISFVRDPDGICGIDICECLKSLNECICDYFNKNNLKTFIIQMPLNFMDIFHPCCIMIRKNKDNEMVQIKVVSNNIQTFPFNKKHVTTHPIETMLKEFNLFKQFPGVFVYESECDPYCDMYAEILRILKSEYYDSIPERFIKSSEQYFRIIYESKEYEDVNINTQPYFVGHDIDKENNPFGVSTTLLSSINTPEEKQTMNQVTEDLKILSEDINDHRYTIMVKKNDVIQNETYPLFIRTEDKRKIFNYKCLRELITDDSEVSIDVSYGVFSSMTGIYKPYEISISASSIKCCRKAKSDTDSADPIQNSIDLYSADYDKLNHIWITINK